MKGSLLGPEYTDAEIENELTKCGAKFRKFSEDDLITEVTKALVDQKAVGWMQGEWNLVQGHLGQGAFWPIVHNYQKKLNLKVNIVKAFGHLHQVYYLRM